LPRRVWIAALSFWPGMPQIWSGQDFLGLLLGIGFALVLNLALLARSVWTEWLTTGWSELLVILTVGYWLACFGYTLWWVWLCHPERHRAEIDRLFREATEFYLQGLWNDARKRYERILTIDETDADALMQLGTLYIRVDQPMLARRAFRRCLELEGGSKWRWEIEQTLGRITSPSTPHSSSDSRSNPRIADSGESVVNVAMPG